MRHQATQAHASCLACMLMRKLVYDRMIWHATPERAEDPWLPRKAALELALWDFRLAPELWIEPLEPDTEADIEQCLEKVQKKSPTKTSGELG